MLSILRSAPNLACRRHFQFPVVKQLSNLTQTAQKSGRILSQGRGVFGALGQGPEIRDSEKFKTVSSLNFCDGDDLAIRLASAGWGHSAAVTNTGKLYIFGRPFDFAILLKLDNIYKVSSWLARAVSGTTSLFGTDATGGYFPTPIPMEVEAAVTDIRCSAGLTLYLTEKGNVFTFGLNRWGQCGVAISPPMSPIKKDHKPHVMEPMQVELPPCQAVEAGLQHCLALTKTGEIYAWGKANRGQMGNVNTEASKMPPYALPALVPLEPFKSYVNGVEAEPVTATQISAGFAHSAALSNEGHVYVWGKGMATQLKEKLRGAFIVAENQLLPRKVELPGGRKAVKICSSNFQVIILAEDGSIWAIGMGEHDRNANPNPLRVQTDFHLPRADSDRSTATAESDPEDGRNYLLVPVNEQTLLCKANNRAVLIVQETPLAAAKAAAALLPPTTSSASSDVIIAPSEKNRANFAEQGMFEIIVHEGEAYLLELEVAVEQTDNTDHVEVEPDSDGEKEVRKGPQMRVLNYSGGWKHNLLVVEDL